MISALFYLQFHSVKNRLLMRFKRLKQPKYLVGAIVGGLYFYFYFFRFLFARSVRSGHWNAATPMTDALPADPMLYESLGALILFVIVFLAWFFPRKRAALAFTEAEVAFLFPAPVGRRGLIHFKLLRSQLGILFTVFIFTLFSGRFGASGNWLTRAVGWWVILFTLNLHFIGSSFALTMLMNRGISTWKRRVAVVGLVLAALGVVGAWAVREFPEFTTANLANPDAIVDYAKQALVSGPLPYLLYLFRIVVKPIFSPDWPGFLVAMGPAALLMALHYVWVIRSDVAFEEASVEASQKMAEKIAAARAGKFGTAGKKLKSKRPPFRLAPTGPPLVALLWKNLISAGSAFTARTWIILVIVAVAMGSSLLGSRQSSTLPVTIAALSGMFGVWAVLLGPQIMRQDFRQDLPQADLLKLYPLRGWQIALGEILAPAVILTGVQWLLLILAVICGVPLARGEMSGGLVLALGAGAAVVLPMLNLISLLIPNAAVLSFPSWFQTGKDAPRGIEATGQRLIFAIGQFLAFIVALIPAAGVWAGFFFLVKFLTNAVLAVPVASVVAALVLALEAGLGVMLLGWLFERFDVSAEQTA
jgi:ABC-2 type transport system permease protein